MANTFDIHIQALPAAEQANTFKFMSFGFDSTLGVKGFQMLINQWLKCFLTPIGSDATDLTYGTVFPNLIGINIAVADARDAVLLALEQCNNKIIGFQKNDTALTSSERLSSAKLVSFVEEPSSPGFSVTVEIQNQAREILALNLPTFSLE